MKLRFGQCAVSLYLLVTVLVAINESSGSAVLNHRHNTNNDEVQKTIVSDSDNVKFINGLLDLNSSGDQAAPITASESFLHNLREQCRRQTSLSYICNNLRLILPIASHGPTASPFTETTEALNHNRKSLLDNLKLQKRFTVPDGTLDTETYITRPEEYDITTAFPTENRYGFYYNHAINKNGNGESIFTGYDRVPMYDEALKQRYDPNMVAGMHETNAYKTHVTGNTAYLNQMTSGNQEVTGNINIEKSQEITSKIMESNEFTTPFTDADTDYDEMEEGGRDGIFRQEQNISLEEDDDTENNAEFREVQEKTDCTGKVNCSGNLTGDSNAEMVEDMATKDGYERTEDMVDRLIDDSVKIFKNSFTIKFPTFERVTNKISEWYQSIFGPKSRDEARGKLKKTLHPIFIGLLVKGVIVLAAVIGFVMKIIAAKAVFFSFASVIFTALVIFRKMTTPQGGTIYVHTNGGAGYKNGGNWDKDSNQPHRTLKDVSGYQVWESNKKQNTEYSTPASTNYQYYNGYYRPNNAVYTTTVSPYFF